MRCQVLFSSLWAISIQAYNLPFSKSCHTITSSIVAFRAFSSFVKLLLCFAKVQLQVLSFIYLQFQLNRLNDVLLANGHAEIFACVLLCFELSFNSVCWVFLFLRCISIYRLLTQTFFLKARAMISDILCQNKKLGIFSRYLRLFQSLYERVCLI